MQTLLATPDSPDGPRDPSPADLAAFDQALAALDELLAVEVSR